MIELLLDHLVLADDNLVVFDLITLFDKSRVEHQFGGSEAGKDQAIQRFSLNWTG